MKKEYISKAPITEVVDYSPNVPFYRAITICEHTLITNDELAPLTGIGLSGEYYAVPGSGAIYRLIGDGVAIPTFASSFVKTAASGDYDETLNTVNLITFLYDGVTYWYSITQAA